MESSVVYISQKIRLVFSRPGFNPYQYFGLCLIFSTNLTNLTNLLSSNYGKTQI